MDQALEVLRMPAPHFIKMDVDGIEHYLLRGGSRVLKGIQGILVEINDDFAEQAEVSKKLLEEAGLTLLEKRHSEMFEGSKFQNLLTKFGFANDHCIANWSQRKSGFSR